MPGTIYRIRLPCGYELETENTDRVARHVNAGARVTARMEECR